jgi:phosphoglycolate phosphatase-like HAD superfamily hydrolase
MDESRHAMDTSDTQPLFGFSTRRSHFVAIDSDGCVFDSMEIKQKECFIPATIKHWGLQPIAKYARETHEFINLHSRWRGSNRFLALIRVFELLEERDEVRRRGFVMPDLRPLREWAARATSLGQPALEDAVAQGWDPILIRTLEWNRAVNAAIEEIVRDVPPFRFVRESLHKLQGQADVVCVSATPQEALEREWRENGLSQLVALVAGLELGPKREQLQRATQGLYDPGRLLMVGDSLGDLHAARAVGALFYPIVPGREESCWERFYREIVDLFLADRYTADIADGFGQELEASLPKDPSWKRN